MLRVIASGGAPMPEVAGEMCREIKEVVYRYSGRVPLALALGVLEIAKHEILTEAPDA